MTRSTLLRSFLAAAAIFALSTAPAWAGMAISGKPKVVFNAEGSPGALDIEGVTNTMTVADDGTTLTFTVPMSTVKSGIALRDDHMNNEYVQVAQFPNATLSFPKASVTWPANPGESSKGTVQASFGVHGVQQPVTVNYDIKKDAAGYTVKAGFDLDASKHGIAIPSYLGITVDPKMKASATVSLVGAP